MFLLLDTSAGQTPDHHDCQGLTQNDISGGKKQGGGLRAITVVRNAPDDNRRHLGRGRPDLTSPPGGSQASISSTAA